MSTADVQEYRPVDGEEFMNERQLEYFKKKLLDWKQDILQESRDTLGQLQEDNLHMPDAADRASSETDKALELRTYIAELRVVAVLAELVQPAAAAHERPHLLARQHRADEPARQSPAAPARDR